MRNICEFKKNAFKYSLFYLSKHYGDMYIGHFSTSLPLSNLMGGEEEAKNCVFFPFITN